MLSGVTYERIDDRGLHILLKGKAQLLEVDHVVICAGQESLRELERELQDAKQLVSVIGGADIAEELDAKRAIEQGFKLALRV